MEKMSKFKKEILKEYISITSYILNCTKIVNETNYFDISRSIERESQKMIGRLRYRD
jgi:hypothetical protein